MNDLKIAMRQLRKSPVFSAMAVLTLALGIGANTAVFSFLDRVFLRSLPVKNPTELVRLKSQTATGHQGDTFIHPVYVSLREQSQQVFSGLLACSLDLATLDVGTWKAEVPTVAVSSDYFSVLGVKPALGRTFLPGEDLGVNPVAVISHEFWRRRMGGDPAVVGRTIRLEGQPLTVVGVADSDFTGTYAALGPGVYVPLATWAHFKGIALEAWAYDWLNLLGRLKPGVTREHAQAVLQVLAERIHSVNPQNTPTAISLADGSRGMNLWTEENLWGPFALVQVVTALVLLIACVNVANLLLVRGATRRKELALRVALGARRWDVIRQLLQESALLALAGGAAGILLARWTTQVLRGAVRIAAVANIPVELDGRILLFAVGMSLATAVVCGLVPALRASRPDLVSALNESSGLLAGLTSRWRLRRLLVVVQVAVTMVVLAVGALCLRSLGKLRVASPGFDTSGLVAVSVDVQSRRGLGVEAHRRMTELKERIAAFPAVQAASLAARVPLSEGGRNKTGARQVEDFEMPAGEEWISWEHEAVGPGYFQTLGVPIVRGRDFSTLDGPQAPRVMIVNELMAQQFWPNQDPIGKRVTFHAEVREVIGVVQTFQHCSIREGPGPLSFWPLAQPMPGQSLADSMPVVLVRVATDPHLMLPVLRAEAQAAGLGLGDLKVDTLAARLSALLVPQRMIGTVLNVFGLVGLLFAGTGIFGVMAYEVSQRTREIGIRMALGAQYREVVRWILSQGLRLTLTGIGCGLAASVLPMALLEAFIPEIRQADQYFLYGVHTWDPLTYAVAGAVVVAVGALAGWLPARRAAKVDPMVALRYE